MFKLFRRERRKKGFTLAELLVVVAILAILVAVAIPIFTGALDEAEEAVKSSAVRSVKAAAVTEILSDWDKYGKSASNSVAKSWNIEASVSKTGDISGLTITPHSASGPVKEDLSVITEDGDNGYKITGMVIADIDRTA